MPVLWMTSRMSFGAGGSRASRSAVADVLGARGGPGVLKEENTGVVVELHPVVEFSDVDGVPRELAGDLVGHPPNPNEAA